MNASQRKGLWKIVTWMGMAMSLGMGTSIRNDYDTLWLVGGLLVMTIGLFGMCFSSRADLFDE